MPCDGSVKGIWFNILDVFKMFKEIRRKFGRILTDAIVVVISEAVTNENDLGLVKDVFPARLLLIFEIINLENSLHIGKDKLSTATSQTLHCSIQKDLVLSEDFQCLNESIDKV
jgi:hypothetical protein